MQYFFILGKNPILSEAEIVAVLGFNDKKFKVLKFLDKVLVLDMEKELDVEWLNARLGGTVKIGKILDQMYELDEFEDKFLEQVTFGSGKAFFGFSLYPLYRINHIEKFQKKLNAIAMNIKSRLRDEKQISSRYVVSKEPELSSVIVAKNKLLKNGAEICFFIDKEVIIFGQTLAVQAFEEFGARDYSRPGRDQVSGMLPPKLARMMINLAQVKSEAVILDPFVGSGTILQEALVLGYQNLIGSDNSDRAIEDTKKNLDWLFEKSKVESLKSKVMKLDVKDLSAKFDANSIDAIITEPYLGPALRGNESQAQIEKTINSLESVYLSAFVQFAKVLSKGGKVVMVFPIYNVRNFQSNLDILLQIEKLGFVKLNKEELVYFRENQFVRRSIVIFKKK
ncbi:MAG: DNA methyltransferase [Candidatus Parcubacteria bacterium]|nr:DNA methyltransferase [Candidatus Parcubacteria bacterium]